LHGSRAVVVRHDNDLGKTGQEQNSRSFHERKSIDFRFCESVFLRRETQSDACVTGILRYNETGFSVAVSRL